MAIHLARKGAQILTFPSAFTVSTGMAHWESLLRARAIEQQCYVIAAAQTGKHNEKRSSYGHTMIVDPWGSVVAQCSDQEGLALAEIDLDYVDKVRSNMPVFKHKRSDLYGLAVRGDIECPTTTEDRIVPFGPVQLSVKSQIVLESSLWAVSVNKKPVVPGHLLVVIKRPSARFYSDLTVEELAEMTTTMKAAQNLTQSFHGCSSCTIAIQDGEHAGQTIPQVHVHIIPRKEGDFEDNDEIYRTIEDRVPSDKDRWRTEQEMEKETNLLREHWNLLCQK